MKSANVLGLTYDVGTGVYGKQTHYLRASVKKVGLKPLTVARSTNRPAIYNGSEVVFESWKYQWTTQVAEAWRYGISRPSFNRRPAQALDRFNAWYRLQVKGTSFQSADQLLATMSIADLADTLYTSYVSSMLGDGHRAILFRDEVLSSRARSGLHQPSARVNAVAGLMSALDPYEYFMAMLPAGGMSLMVDKLLQRSKATVHTHAEVKVVRRLLPSGAYQLDVASSSTPTTEDVPPSPSSAASSMSSSSAASSMPSSVPSSSVSSSVPSSSPSSANTSKPPAAADPQTHTLHGPFDAVVLATPLALSGGLRFEGVPSMSGLPPATSSRPYLPVVVTFATGVLNGSFFGVPEDGDPRAKSRWHGLSSNPLEWPGALLTWLLGVKFLVVPGGRSGRAPVAPAGPLFATDSAGGAIASVAAVRELGDGTQLFRIESSRRLEEEVLDALFVTNSTVGFRVHLVHEWPQGRAPMHPPSMEADQQQQQQQKTSAGPRYPPFQLAPGLVYNNALDSVYDSAEMSCMGAKNSVFLIRDYLDALAAERKHHGTHAAPAAIRTATAASPHTVDSGTCQTDAQAGGTCDAGSVNAAKVGDKSEL